MKPLNGWAAHRLQLLRDAELALDRARAAQTDNDTQRSLLFHRCGSLGVRVVPFAGQVFLWQILRELENGGN